MNPLISNIKLSEQKTVRSHWDADAKAWHFPVIDVVEILTGTDRPRKYWNDVKKEAALGKE